MIEIVRSRPEHQAQIVALVLDIQQREFGIPITLEEQPDLLDIPGTYAVGCSAFWVALDAGAVVGTIALIDSGRGFGSLRKMFVAKSHRGGARGTAQRLLEELLAHAHGAGLSSVWLGTTETFRAAHRFYEKNGFVEVPGEAVPPGGSFNVKFDTRFYRLHLSSAAGNEGGPAKRRQLIDWVQRLLDGAVESDAQATRLLAEIKRNVPHPSVSDLIFYPPRPMTAEQIVDEALVYPPRR